MMFFPMMTPIVAGRRSIPMARPIITCIAFAASVAVQTLGLNWLGAALGWYMGEFTGYIATVGLLGIVAFGSLAFWAMGQLLSSDGLAHATASASICLMAIASALGCCLVCLGLLSAPFPWERDTFQIKVHARLFHESAPK